MSSPKLTLRPNSFSYGTYTKTDSRSSAYLSRSVSTPYTKSIGYATARGEGHTLPLSVGRRPPVSAHEHFQIDGASVITHSSSSPVNSPRSPASGAGNQFVSEDLLKGVSINFDPPIVSDTQTSMSLPIPNAIELPYGRGPPLHIKAPNWHALVALLSRLNNTMLVPKDYDITALEDLPVYTLRAVVNFVKVHSLSNEWQAIVYLTVDYPVPDGRLYTAYTQNNPSVLPFSYTKSPTPEPLRCRADSPSSKWFTIPALVGNPYLTLPTSFPDLASYLSRAVEFSRRSSARERSSGYHRLAKTIDKHYPSVHSRPLPWAAKLRIFLGMRRTKSSREENDDRSTMVTPFNVDGGLP